MTIEQIVEKLTECPSYVKDGPKRMSEKLKISIEDAKEALKTYRSRKKKIGIVELENHLDSLGLQIEDVKQIKFWQNFNGEKRYSVDTKK
jgi:rubrerythrin